MSRYARRISGTERAWWVAGALYGPFAIQLVLDGDGALDVTSWAAAAAVAGAACPGVRVRWRGRACGSRWVDSGVAPPVVEVDGQGWDGEAPDGAPFLDRPVDPVDGAPVEVLLVRGPTPRVVVRGHHAVVDGMGLIAFAEALVAARRGEEPPALDDPVDEVSLARGVGSRSRPPPPDDAVSLTGPHVGAEPGVTWVRRQVSPGPSGLLGATLEALATHVGPVDGPVRFGVPADLRRVRPARSTANLTGILTLPVEPGDDAASLGAAVRSQVAAGGAGDAVRGAALLRHLPVGLIRWASRRGAARHRHTDRFGVTAVVSHFGVFDLDRLSGGGWTTRRVTVLPPGAPVTAAFVAIWRCGEAAGLSVTVPRPLATDGRLDAAADAIVAGWRGAD